MLSTFVNQGWTRLLLFFTLLLLAGCGGNGSDDYVVNAGGAPSAGQSGSLTFNFVRAQAALAVPQATARIRFEFFDGPDGTGQPSQPSQVRDFAPSITISPVVVTTRSVVVTALDANGVPLLESTTNVLVSSGSNVVVDLSSGAVANIVLESLAVSPSTSTVAIGATQAFSASATYSNGETIPALTVTWSSGTPAVAGISSQGQATGLTPGRTAIRATVGSVVGEALLTVGGTQTLTTLTVSPAGEMVGIGGLKQFTVAGKDQNGQPFALAANSVTWTTSANLQINSTANTSVVVRGLTAGSAAVTATVGAVSGTASTTVAEPALDGIVSVSPSPISLTIGATQTLTTVGSFGTAPNRVLTNADKLNYISADLGVATVTSAGLVTAVGAGTTTITASAGDFRQSVPVVVTSAGVANVAPVVSFPDTTLAFKQGAAAQALFTSVNVTDDQLNLAGGQLTIALSGVNTDVVLNVTSAVNIGTVTGSGGNAISVALSADATPANIATFLSSIEISSPAGRALGSGRATVGLTDGRGGSNLANRPGANYVVAGASAEIFRVPGPGLTTIQAAVDAAELNGTPNVVILVSAGTYPENVSIPRMAGLAGLQLLGPNAGISAGAQAAGTTAPVRVAEATVNSITTLPPDVNIDGFTLVGGGGDAFSLGAAATGFTLQNTILANNGPSTARGSFRQGGAPANVTIANNSFRGWLVGFHLGVGDGLSFAGLRVRNNIFEGNATGLSVFRGDRPSVTGNSFVNNNLEGTYADHLVLKTAPGPAAVLTGDVSGNDFTGVGALKLTTGGSISAESNYWGPGGPVIHNETTLTGNVFPNTTVVDVDPFSLTRFTNYPR